MELTALVFMCCLVILVVLRVLSLHCVIHVGMFAGRSLAALSNGAPFASQEIGKQPRPKRPGRISLGKTLRVRANHFKVTS